MNISHPHTCHTTFTINSRAAGHTPVLHVTMPGLLMSIMICAKPRPPVSRFRRGSAGGALLDRRLARRLAMNCVSLHRLGGALSVVAGILYDDALKAAEDLGSIEALLRDEEMNLEGHADMYCSVRSGWHHLTTIEFNRRPSETDDMAVPPQPKAKFIAAINACMPKLPQAAALALNSQLRSFRGRLSWAGMSTATADLLGYLEQETGAALPRVRAAESRRDELRRQRDQLRSDAYAVAIAGHAAELQLRKAQGLLAPPLPASLPAAGRPAGAAARRSRPLINPGRRGASGGPGPANTDPVALGLLRRAAVQVVRELSMGEVELEVELNQAEADRLEAHLSYVAHSDFYSDLLIHYNSFDDADPRGGLTTAGLREAFADAVRRNQPALTRDVGQFWADKLSTCLHALHGPIPSGALMPAVGKWLTNLSRQTADDLWVRGQAKIRRDSLQLRLAQARSDSYAARLAVLAIDVLSRRQPGELLPAEPVPATQVPARLPAELPLAEAPTAQSSLTRPSLRRRGAALGWMPQPAQRYHGEGTAEITATSIQFAALAITLG